MSLSFRFECFRSSILPKTTLRIDGDRWCALYGIDLQEGIAGFGGTPHDAIVNLYDNYCRDTVEKHNGKESNSD